MNDSSAKLTVLLTGAGGLFGARLGGTVPDTYKLHYHYHRPPDGEEMQTVYVGDLDVPIHVRTLADTIDPDIIVNSAALADVDRCETDPALSYRANVGAVRHLLDNFPGARFVQVSTDYVFSDDNKRGESPPTVGNGTGPINVYGEHKLEAEQIVLAASPRHLVVRVNSLFDYRGRRNIFSHVLSTLSDGKRVHGYTDQISNPISSITAAELTWELIRENARGIFHIGGREVVSRYEFARRIADYFNLDDNLITASTSANRSRPARRPIRAGLDCRETELFLNRAMPFLRDEFERLRIEMNG